MIWLLGCNGMLGRELAALLEAQGAHYIGTGREVDITDTAALTQFAEGKSITWVVNCAAYTAVDKAEDEVDACSALNARGAGNVAACAKEIGAAIIHVSTDYVFEGTGSVPYREDDATSPTGVYGRTKLEGELLVLGNNPRAYVIRTSWLYGMHGKNFVATMLNLMNTRESITVVDDQRGSPTWTFDLANAIFNFINANAPFGIYHYANEGNITWHEFALEIFARGKELGLIEKECRVLPCSSAEWASKVRRPAFSVLDKTKIKSALGITIPGWDESLRRYLLCVH